MIYIFDIFTLIRFCSQHEEKPGLGFVLKNPYATNSTPWFPKTVEQIMHTLIILNSKYYGKIPYTMLQPCMASRKVCFILILYKHNLNLIGI